jgi:hypothetical protein
MVLRSVLVSLSLPKIMSEGKKSHEISSYVENSPQFLTKHLSIVIGNPVTASCPSKLKISVKFLFSQKSFVLKLETTSNFTIIS